jgi:tetratricopeptide (TPR) repeat protein
MKRLFEFFRRPNADNKPMSIVPTASDETPDLPAIVTFRSGETLVMSNTVMEARLALVQGLADLLNDPDEAFRKVRRSADLLQSYSSEVDQETLDLIADVAGWLVKLGDNAGSIPLFNQAVKAAKANPRLNCEQLSDHMTEVGVLLLRLPFNELGIVERLFSEALDLHVERFGAAHARIGGILYLIADIFEAMGEYETSLEFFKRSAAVRSRALGDDHVDTSKSYDGLARLMLQLGQNDSALQYANKVCANLERTLCPKNVDLARSLETMALCLKRKGDLKGAEAAFRRALGIYEAVAGAGDGGLAILLGNLASVLLMTGRMSEALPVLHRALTLKEKAVGKNSTSVAHTLFQLANTYASQGDFSHARPFAQRACAINDSHYGKSHPEAQRSRDLLNHIEHDMRRTGQL